MASVCLRPICREDLPFVADVAAQAMLEDELFAYLCPHRHTHYADFRLAFLRRLKRRMVTPGCVMVVAVEQTEPEHELNGGARIRGYAAWERMGTGAGAARWHQSKKGSWHALERLLLAIEDRYLALVAPDRSVDLPKLAHYKQASAVDCFPFDTYPELWYLDSLAVDPGFQRRGIGRQLVEWGLQQGRQEQVAVGLEASIKGTSLYERVGFRAVNSTELMPGLAITAMLWQDPLGLEDDSQG
ncbi:GNAT family acetyltransferase [Penicillium canariense]|uniref:GNAT family acetyltransferase n=1 Tax=Penicillium canariense TaxID=189055 RepID=A0A9W9HPP7_9EURO|nr:GNAT family acetyltransferase [Penicillium canariense]KAJ5152614.1 GNAT family acetyltransferase [Penicillium canariense]